MDKPIIYQILPRLWGNRNGNPVSSGSLEENGSGRFSDISPEFLDYLKWLGCSHVWYTGVIRHATKSNSCGCTPSHPQLIKGEAGSPYSIENYFDVNPYLADDPGKRMEEFCGMVERTHKAGLKVILDFVPNHVSRDYGKVSPAGVTQEGYRCTLGEGDDRSVHWKAENDFFYYPGEALRLPDQDMFMKECDALRKMDFTVSYRILPAWLVAMCRRYAEEHAGDRKGYDLLLSSFSTFLTPYHEEPAMATGNNCYNPAPGINDWYETVKLNYTDSETGTWEKMYNAVRFWASKGVDGFRCDMVELVPCAFFKWLISKVKAEFPDVIFIAEVYKKDLYKKYIREIGFSYLYDKSGLYDTLRSVVEKNVSDNGMPVELWQSATGITRNWQFLGDLQPYMLNFLENHDEQRFASDFFGKEASNSYAALAVSLFLNRAPFMLYFGQEMGERGMDEEGFSGKDGRTTIFDWWTPQSVRSIRKIIEDGSYMSDAEDGKDSVFGRYSKALRFAATDPAIQHGTVYDLCYCNLSSDGFDKDRHFAWLRDYEDETLLFVANFSGHAAETDIMIPAHAFEWLGIPLTEDLNPSRHIHVSVPPMDYVMIRLV